MTSRALPVGVLCLCVLACGRGDNSGAVKAHATIKPGMPIWEALDIAEQSQFPDIFINARGEECSHPGIVVGRHNGPRFVRVYRQMDADKPNLERAYIEEGFATREEFVAAVRARTLLFTGCQRIFFWMGRYQGWSEVDSFTVTLDPEGLVKTISPLENID